MNIQEMSDERKSVMLAKLCGWIHPAGEEFKEGLWEIDAPCLGFWSVAMHWMVEPSILPHFNLYEVDEMSAAWRVLIWAFDNLSAPSHHFALRNLTNSLEFFTLSPEDAQRLWLDKILSLAIEAGMIEGDGLKE